VLSQACRSSGRHCAFPTGVGEPVEVRIPFATLWKIAFFAFVLIVIIKLWLVIVMIIVAGLIAVMLDPLVGRLAGMGMGRGIAIAIVGLLLFGIVGAFLFAVIPTMFSQLQTLAGEMPRIGARLAQALPAAKPVIDEFTARAQRPPNAVQMQQWLTRGLIGASYAIAGITALILTLVLAIYLLIEGRRAFEWLIAFASEARREKLRRTARGVGPIINAYMRGQAITCCLCGGVALTTLLLLRLPGAVALAVLAFVADLVPVVGTIAMTIPAVALALIVSPIKAIIVAAVYLAYHLTESYWIIPRVYGKEMRLSTLTVLLAVTVGGALQGALGAVLILPFVAAYPVVERIWLREQLGAGTVADHRRIETAE
jgi:predicted PurR-regulated permease PerM